MFSDFFKASTSQNLTFIIDILRYNNGLFRNYNYFGFSELTDSFFSLLKFDPNRYDNDDFSKYCLAANLSYTLDYLTVFPINCSTKSVNTMICYRSTPLKYMLNRQLWEATDFLFNPLFEEVEEYNNIKIKNELLAAFKHIKMTAAFENTFSALWYTSLPCFDLKDMSSNLQGGNSILRQCKWKGLQIPCSAIFKTFPTDRGMCCSFNMEAAEDIFVHSAYTEQIKLMQNKDKYLSYENPVLPKSYMDNREPNTEPGRNKGLSLIIDAHADILSAGSVPTETNGFVGLIRPRRTVPTTTLQSFDIRSGHNNIVAISSTIVSAQDELRSLAPAARSCLFEDEDTDLRLHKYYSHSNCLFECFFYSSQLSKQKEDITARECIPWFFPSSYASPSICDPWQASEVLDLMWNVTSFACSHCLPDCNTVIYKTMVTAVPFKACDLTNLGLTHLCDINDKNPLSPKMYSNLVLNNFMARFNTTPNYGRLNLSSSSRKRGSGLIGGHMFDDTEALYDAFETDVAKVQIYFKTASVQRITQQPTMTWIDYYSNVGGILGFVLGMGIVTIFEIIFLVLKILKTLAIKSNFVTYFQIVKFFESTSSPSL